MPNNQTTITLALGSDLFAAVSKLAKRRKTSPVAVVRGMVAEAVGKPEAAEAVRVGRPRKAGDADGV